MLTVLRIVGRHGYDLPGLVSQKGLYGALAQLARASDLHSEGHRFDSDMLH